MNLLKSASPSDTLDAYTPDISDPSTAGQLRGFSNRRLPEGITEAERDPLVADEIHPIDSHISMSASHANVVSPLPLVSRISLRSLPVLDQLYSDSFDTTVLKRFGTSPACKSPFNRDKSGDSQFRVSCSGCTRYVQVASNTAPSRVKRPDS